MAKLNHIHVATIDFWDTIYKHKGTAEFRRDVRSEFLRSRAITIGISDADVPNRLFEVVDTFIKRRWRSGLSSSREDIVSFLIELYGAQVRTSQIRYLLDSIDEIYRTVLKPRQLKGAADFVAWLSARVPLYLISDTYTIQGSLIDQILKEDLLFTAFKGRLYSDTIGVQKPAPAALEWVLNEEQIAPEYLVHIGDLEDRDVEMARRVGANSILLAHSRHALPQGERQDLSPIVWCRSFCEVRTLIEPFLGLGPRCDTSPRN